MARISGTKIVRSDDTFFENVLEFYRGLPDVGAHLVYDRDCVFADRMIVCLVGDSVNHTFSDIVFLLFDTDSISRDSKTIIDNHRDYEFATTGDGGIVYGLKYLYSYGVCENDLCKLKGMLADYLSDNTDFYNKVSHDIIKSYHRNVDEYKKKWMDNTTELL